MRDGQGAEAGETAGKSQSTDNGPEGSFQRKLNDALESWRKEGCKELVEENEAGQALPNPEACGAMPHRVKMGASADGLEAIFKVSCAAGHEDQWELRASAAEVKKDGERQAAALAEAQKNAGDARDPLKATVTITMDVRTQEITISDAYVPNPGIGALMCLVGQKKFLDQLTIAPPKAGLVLPKANGILHPKTGKPIKTN